MTVQDKQMSHCGQSKTRRNTPGNWNELENEIHQLYLRVSGVPMLS